MSLDEVVLTKESFEALVLNFEDSLEKREIYSGINSDLISLSALKEYTLNQFQENSNLIQYFKNNHLNDIAFDLYQKFGYEFK